MTVKCHDTIYIILFIKFKQNYLFSFKSKVMTVTKSH